MKNVSKEELIAIYESGKSILEMSRQIDDMTYEQIRRSLIREGVQIRGGRKRKNINEDQIGKFKKLYYEEYLSFKEIARELGLFADQLERIMIDNDLPKRSHRKTINSFVNQDYFEVIDTPTKAYFVGLLFTDGSVRKYRNSGQLRLSLQADDVSIIERLKEELNAKSKLVYDKRSNGCYELAVSNDKIFNDLAKYNIIPNKTYSVKHLPTTIPEDFKRDFVRGLYDGDGGVTFCQNMSTDVTVNFASYYESVVTEFRNLIDELIRKENHLNPIYTTCWHVQWRGYNQVMKILNALYDGADVYIERKYNKYLQLLNRNHDIV